MPYVLLPGWNHPKDTLFGFYINPFTTLIDPWIHDTPGPPSKNHFVRTMDSIKNCVLGSTQHPFKKHHHFTDFMTKKAFLPVGISTCFSPVLSHLWKQKTHPLLLNTNPFISFFYKRGVFETPGNQLLVPLFLQHRKKHSVRRKKETFYYYGEAQLVILQDGVSNGSFLVWQATSFFSFPAENDDSPFATCFSFEMGSPKKEGEKTLSCFNHTSTTTYYLYSFCWRLFTPSSCCF